MNRPCFWRNLAGLFEWPNNKCGMEFWINQILRLFESFGHPLTWRVSYKILIRKKDNLKLFLKIMFWKHPKLEIGGSPLGAIKISEIKRLLFVWVIFSTMVLRPINAGYLRKIGFLEPLLKMQIIRKWYQTQTLIFYSLQLKRFTKET